jgi:5-methyltetrahydropteroyltriglutamate--homocysteine methyltransferase
VEHVGSFVRPDCLVQASRDHRAGKIDSRALRQIADQAVTDIIRFQEGVGLPSVTDGEFRRRSWSAGFIDAVEGFGLRAGNIGFRTSAGGVGAALSPYAKSRLKRTRGIATDEFSFLKSTLQRGLPKTTIPAPDVMHFFLGPHAVDKEIYPDVEMYFADLVAIYRSEIAELAGLECTYLQLDDTALPCNCDADVRASVRCRGDDPDRLTGRYNELLNDVLAQRPADMTVAMHMCRGNLKGAWMAQGGYEPIAERLFQQAEVDAFFLEFDTPRAGDFAPLRFVPKDKSVVLGLISSKTPALESADDIKRRIDEATRYVDLERLCLSPQCGFSSGAGSGQTVTQDDTRRKLELAMQVAASVWGSDGR